MTLEQFESAVLEHRNRVYGFALHFLGSRQEAEDVTQDVFIRLWDNRERIDVDTQLSWVLRVARNACVDQYRKRRTRDNRHDSSVDAASEVAATMEDPDQQIDNEKLRQQIMDSVDRLKEPYKSIVVLREIQDLSYEEIGVALELPLTSVKVYLHRARKMLRETLRSAYGDLLGGASISTSEQTV